MRKHAARDQASHALLSEMLAGVAAAAGSVFESRPCLCRRRDALAQRRPSCFAPLPTMPCEPLDSGGSSVLVLQLGVLPRLLM
mmetsp:Transcript_95041/g.188289  ORF Transcript_95041/g.188289 Transcript_95041/m.188289 type:complete len:83 (-) Transcript_95041:30-278(-)